MRLKKFNFKIVNSTNDIAIKIIKSSKCKSGIIVAEKQRKGRGQYGKKWTSYKGNLFVSIFFKVEKIHLSLKQITYLNCLLVKKLLSFYYKKKINIKKPNDLLINKKKISGILQEIVNNYEETFIIVGIGINLVRSPYIIDNPTTNLYEITKKKFDINDVTYKLKSIYENFIPKIQKNNFKKLNKNLI
jgi:BirA family transcriptional regulator, biotin operon repressor / biotin---[acetyl-CoA-carboxylase] ligase